MSDLEMKSFGPFEIKSEDRGEVVAVVATLGVVDKDGDVIMAGAVPPGGAKVKLSGFGHDAVLKDLPPVGKGLITEQGDKLVFTGKFFLSTARGREAFNYVREMGEEGEWSFGFPRATKNATLTDEWRTKGAKRLIAGMAPFEASPVFVGAGWGTGTLLTKSAEPEGEPPLTAEGVVEMPAEPVDAEGVVPMPEPVEETPVEPVESEEAKAAREADLALKAKVDDAMAHLRETQARIALMDLGDSCARVQRVLKRIGDAA